MTGPILIARCPEHGVSQREWQRDGERVCVVCGMPVEMVPAVPVAEVVEFLQSEQARQLTGCTGVWRLADNFDAEFGRWLESRLGGAQRECPHGDPACPCNDGDPCNYESLPGSPAMAPPGAAEGER